MRYRDVPALMGIVSLTAIGCSGQPPQGQTAAPTSGRIRVVDQSGSNYGVIQDTQTGREYLVVNQIHGIAVTPILPKEPK